MLIALIAVSLLALSFATDAGAAECRGTGGSTRVACWDFNDDNKSDILWRNSDGTVAIWLMNGTIMVSGDVPGVLPLDRTILGVGDFDGDGHADILFRSNTGDVSIWFMNGPVIASQGPVANIGTDWIARVGDFNNDGKADVLWWQPSTGNIRMWLMDGLTITSQGIIGNAPTDWIPRYVGDFNGDGKADILWRRTNGEVAVWFLDGLNILGSGFVGTIPTTWFIAGVGDFNNDGRDDILWRNVDGTVAIWLIDATGLGIQAGGILGPVAYDWTLAAVRDFSGDGKADIAWRHATGMVSIWLMDGVNLTTFALPGSAPTSWTIEHELESPEIINANATTFTIGQAGTFTVNAPAFPRAAITRGGVALPSPLQYVDNGDGTGTLSGTPDPSTDGAYGLSFTADNGVAPTSVQNPFTLTVVKQAQAINFTSTAPGSATAGGPTYNVTATGGASGNPVTFTIDASATSVCSIAGSTVSFTGVGTCVIDANQAANGTYSAAPQVQQSFAVGVGSQTINFTSPAPGSATVGGTTYNVTATGGGSGNPVTFTIDASATSVCSIVGSTVSFTAVGTCVIDANQAGDANYNAAPQAQQSFAVGKGSQTINFTSTAPTDAKVSGPTYSVTATGGASGNAVTFTIDAVATNMCSIVGSTVSFGPNPGTCVIDANQLGNANYNAASQVQQSFLVHQAPAITSNNTTTFTVGQANTFSVTTTGTPTVTSIVMASVTPGPGGTLPSGVNFTYVSGANGTLAGNPSNAAQVGTYVVSFTASNGTPPDAVQNPFTLTVVCPAITLGPANNSIFTATYNVLFTQAFTPSGGTGPYTYTLGGAALPNVAFSGNNLTGTPNNTGSFAFTAQAVDAKGCTSPNQSYTLNVNPSVTNDTYPTSVIGNVFTDSSAVPYSVVTNDSFPAGTASISAFDTTGTFNGTPSAGGTMSMTTSGADVGKFTYDPPRGKTGSDVFNYTLSSNGRTASGTVSITVANKIWFIDGSSSCSSSCDGRQSHPYTTLSAFSTANTGAVPAPQDGDPIFIYTGAGYLGPLTLRNNQKVLGQGAGISLASFTGFTAGAGQSLPATGGTFPSITTSAASTNAVNLGGGTGNTLRGFNIGNTTGSKISGSSFGTLTTSEITLSGSGQALNLTTGTLSGSLTGTTSSSGTNNVMLSGVGTSGTYDLASGALSGASGDALLISGGAGSFTYSGTIASGSAHSVNINGKTGGSTVRLDGAITDTDTGISLTNNGASSGATITFRGGLNISTGVNAAFTATGGGTVNVCAQTACSSGSAVVNTLTTTTATALNVANTTIGASGLTFQSISSSGGTATGIILDTTGSSGGLTVTGDGSNTSVGGNSTGGTISGKSQSADGSTTTGIGIYLNSTSNVVLRRMTINGTNQNYGIRAFAVNNMTLEYSTIGGTNGTTASIDNYGEGSVYFGNATNNGITGTGTFTNNNISGGYGRNMSVVNGGAAATLTLTVKGTTFGAMQNHADGGDSFATEVRTSGSTINVTFGGTNAGEPNTLTNAVGNVTSFAAQTGASMDVQFKNNALSNNNANNIIGGTSIIIQGQGTTTFVISGNTMRDANGSAIALGKQSVSPLQQGQVINNTVGVAGTADSGSKSGNGIFISASGTGTIAYTIKDNTIQQIHGNAPIYADNTGGSYTANFTIEHNTFNDWQGTNFAGIAVTNGAPGTPPTDTVNVCAKIGGTTVGEKNTFNLGANLAVIVGSSGAAAGHTFNLPGYAGGANLTNVQNFIAGNNTMNTGTVSAYADAPATAAAFTGTGTTCPTP